MANNNKNNLFCLYFLIVTELVTWTCNEKYTWIVTSLSLFCEAYRNQEAPGSSKPQ